MGNLLRIFLQYRQYRFYYFAISFLTILAGFITTFMPLLTGRFIDAIGNKKYDATYFTVLAIIIFVLNMLFTVIANWNGYLGDQLKVKLVKSLSNEYYNKVLGLPISYFDSNQSGKIISRLSRSIMQITNFIQMMTNNFLQFILVTIMSIGLAAYYDVRVAILLFTLYPIFTFMTIKTSDKWQKYQTEINQNTDEYISRFTESVNEIKLVKSYQQESNELKFMNLRLNNIIRINKPQSKLWHRADVKRRFVLDIIFLAVNVLIFREAYIQHLTVGEAVALIMISANIRMPIFSISFLVENTIRAMADSKDYFEVMTEDSENIKESKVNVDMKSKLAVNFKNINFSYGDKNILEGFNLQLKAGLSYALVGESGQGKTTITNLIMGLYENYSGSLKLFDAELKELGTTTIRKISSVVLQEPAIFSGTIYDNIAYGDTSKSKKEVIAAAKQAFADEFITKYDKGYDTMVGERGLKLSGGQKQRIAIARAILKDAPILILDEATSSLDAKSEKLVQIALNKLMQSRTTIVIAHRLSTIKDVDQIITIKNGKVIEQGSPDVLATSGGIYTELLEITKQNNETKLKSFGLASDEDKD